MLNLYTVKLSKPLKLPSVTPQFGRETSNLFVVASSFDNALLAAVAKYPEVEIRGVDLLNYAGTPIVIGE